MKNRIIELAVSWPRTIYLVTFLLVVALGLQIPRIHIDTDPENMLAADQPDRVFHNLVEDRFVLHDAIVVGIVNETHPDGIFNVDSLAGLYTLSKQILEIDGVITPDLMSLAEADNITQGENGAIRFERFMSEAPTSPEQARYIREMVYRLPLLVDTLVSGDGRAAAIYVPIESKDLSYPISTRILALAEKLPGDDQYHVTGLPVAEDTFGVEMFIQMGISAPLAGLMIFLLMWYFFRSPRLIVAPMIVAMVTVISIMGLLIGLGFTVHIMSSMIPIFLMPIAVVDSVHIMSEFADSYRPGKDPRAVIREVVSDLFTPMLFTSLTSAAGFASLLLTPIPPVQVFGAFVAVGILLAFALTIVFIPAYVVGIPVRSMRHLGGRKSADSGDSLLARTVRASGHFAFTHGKTVIGVTLVLLVLSIVGVSRIEVNDNPTRWFKADHRIRIADRVLNKHFAGTYDAFLVLDFSDPDAVDAFRRKALGLLDSAGTGGDDLSELRGLIEAGMPDTGAYYDNIIGMADDLSFELDGEALDAVEAVLDAAEKANSQSRYFQQPSVLREIEDLQKALMDTGRVGKTSALPDVVSVVNRELHGGDPQYYAIPDTVPAVAQTLLQYQSSHRPQDLWHMVTPDYRSAAIWLQLKSGNNQDMSRLVEAMDAYLVEHPLPAGLTARWAGKTYINEVWQKTMVTGMLFSLLGAFAMVFVMMTLLFRSIRFGLLAMLPLSITIIAVYGLVGWMRKDYDMPIAVLSSLTLGLSVDFAIHFIQRLRALHDQAGSFNEAARQIFEEPARAISRNAIVIALGFTPLLLAPLVPYVTVGAFMASIMVISCVATLLLLPAVASTFQQGLFGRKSDETESGG